MAKVSALFAKCNRVAKRLTIKLNSKLGPIAYFTFSCHNQKNQDFLRSENIYIHKRRLAFPAYKLFSFFDSPKKKQKRRPKTNYSLHVRFLFCVHEIASLSCSAGFRWPPHRKRLELRLFKPMLTNRLFDWLHQRNRHRNQHALRSIVVNT